MNNYRQIIQNAQTGQIVPVVKRIDIDDSVDYFARLSDYGRTENTCFFESREYLAGSRALSFGTAQPALYLTGREADFTIQALSPTGKRMIKYLSGHKQRFAFCKTVQFDNETIKGTINRRREIVDEYTRLSSTNQMDVLRAVAFAFELASKPFRVTCGLLGAISYDFIDEFEKLPRNETDLLENPDYELYFADNIFLMDHEHAQGYVIVNVVITDDDYDKAISEAQEHFDYYFNAARFKTPAARQRQNIPEAGYTDTEQDEYERIVKTAKRHIVDGDIFQAVLSRTKVEPCPDEPLDVYKRLRKLNPSPYMFYINTPSTILLGSSPELNLRVSGTEDPCVEIRPIVGQK